MRKASQKLKINYKGWSLTVIDTHAYHPFVFEWVISIGDYKLRDPTSTTSVLDAKLFGQAAIDFLISDNRRFKKRNELRNKERLFKKVR